MSAEEPLQVGNACTSKVELWESDEKLHPVESGDLSEIQVSLSLAMILNVGVLVVHSTDSVSSTVSPHRYSAPKVSSTCRTMAVGKMDVIGRAAGPSRNGRLTAGHLALSH